MELTRTSDAAILSGNASFPCSSTIRYFLRGITNKTPKIPPRIVIVTICNNVISPFHITIAGNVNTIPPAKDSPIPAIPATIFDSKILFRPKAYSRAVPSIDVGIIAAIVIPTFNAKYTFAAAKTAANMHPTTMDAIVNSGNASLTEI